MDIGPIRVARRVVGEVFGPLLVGASHLSDLTAGSIPYSDAWSRGSARSFKTVNSWALAGPAVLRTRRRQRRQAKDCDL